MEKKEQELYEAYTDAQGFSWDEHGDIVGIPDTLKQESEERMNYVIQMVKEGKLHARK